MLVLPLNHVHGIVNVTLCPLAVGACCEAPGSFDAAALWERFASGEVTVFMAVPTIYARLVTAWEAASTSTRQRWSAGAAGLRLMVCGSAALPVSTLERWRELTGQVLLERYGMSELGMALSNTLTKRVPGHVGEPFPGVEVRVVGDDGADVAEGQPGELLVRGPQVFAGYWGRPEATADAFVDGWFRTGDVAVHEPDGYRLLGRSSVDIIKTGGEKVSALEIEEVLRTHPAIADCAVVGARRPGVGPARRRRRRAGRRGGRRHRTRCGRGASSSWPRPRCRRGSCSSPSCPATRWARSSSRGSPSCSESPDLG